MKTQRPNITDYKAKFRRMMMSNVRYNKCICSKIVVVQPLKNGRNFPAMKSVFFSMSSLITLKPCHCYEMNFKFLCIGVMDRSTPFGLVHKIVTECFGVPQISSDSLLSLMRVQPRLRSLLHSLRGPGKKSKTKYVINVGKAFRYRALARSNT